MLAIVEAIKVKKEVARGGKCWKNIWMGILSVTGELVNCLPKTYLFILLRVLLLSLQILSDKAIISIKKSPETWILPITVLFAMVAYAACAIVFYNNDG